MEFSGFCTEREAARLLNISLSTIRRWRKTGEVPVFRVGDILRYCHESLM
jgi:excisionase family DNA binding protein